MSNKRSFQAYIFSCDVIGYSKRKSFQQAEIKARLENCLQASLLDGYSRAGWSDAGDGGYLFLEGEPDAALVFTEEFVKNVRLDNDNSNYDIEYRVALSQGLVTRQFLANDELFSGDCINDTARILDGMPKEISGQVVASGSYKEVLENEVGVDPTFMSQMEDIIDKNEDGHRVWNLYSQDKYGVSTGSLRSDQGVRNSNWRSANLIVAFSLVVSSIAVYLFVDKTDLCSLSSFGGWCEKPPLTKCLKSETYNADLGCVLRKTEYIKFNGDVVTFRDTGNQYDLSDPEVLKLFYGQIFITGFDSLAYMNNEDSEWQQAYNKLGLGGVFIDKRNLRPSAYTFGSDKHDVSLVHSIIERAKNGAIIPESIPRFVAADHEGGNAAQLMKRGYTSALPAPMGLSSLRDMDAVRVASGIASEELGLLGINMKLGPVVDLNAEKRNRDIRDRSFGDDSNDVSSLAGIEVQQNNESGLLSVLKHFPGHGHTVSGFDTPDPAVSYHRINTIKAALEPFRKLVSSPAIMTSHMKVESIDVDNVTTDKRIITDLLRSTGMVKLKGSSIRGLGYEGLVMTDDLNEVSFTALSVKTCKENIDTYIDTLKENSLSAFDAGHDILLYSHLFEFLNLKEKKYATDVSEAKRVKIYSTSKPNFNWCARWAMSLNEFQKIYDYIKAAIFDGPLDFQRIERQRSLKESVIRILKAKNDYVYPSVGKSNLLKLEQAIKDNKRCADSLIKNAVTTMQATHPKNELHLLKNLSSDDKVFFFSMINDNMKNNVPDEDMYKLIYRYHRNLKDVIAGKVGNNYKTVLLKKNPTGYAESNLVVSKIVNTVADDSSTTQVIFYIDSFHEAWDAIQIAIEKLVENGFPPERIHTIIVKNPSILNSTKDESDNNARLQMTNLYVVYSAYEAGAKLQIESIFNGDNTSSTVLPIRISGLNPNVSALFDSGSYDCN